MKKRAGVFLLSLLLCMLMIPVNVMAADTENKTQDGIAVRISTDQAEYAAGEEVQIKVIVTNHNASEVTNVKVQNILPDYLEWKKGANPESKIGTLAVGEEKVITVTAVVKGQGTVTVPSDGKDSNVPAGGTDIKTGDSSPMFLLFALLLVSGAVILVLAGKKKSARSVLSLFLCAAMVSSLALPSLTVKAQGKSISVSKRIRADGKECEVGAVVTYHDSGEESEVPDSGQTVTREEWLLALADMFGLEGVDDGQHSYDDFAQAQKPEMIEAAVRRGIVPDLKPDGDNMVYFRPDEAATREFAAYTAVHALEYDFDQNASPAWDDAGQLTYPAEDLKAVSIGILSIAENRFMPERHLTASEKAKAAQVIGEILSKTAVSEDADEHVVYAEGVQETEAVYELDRNNQMVEVAESDLISGWKTGEVHVLKSADGAEEDIAVKIKEIRKANGKTVILYEEPKLEEVVSEFDVQGTEHTEGTLTAAEGISIEDEKGSRAAASGEVPLFGKKKVSFNMEDVSFTGSIDIQNMEYRFAASPSWHFVTIDEVYLALNSKVDFDISYMKKAPKNKKIHLGTFKAPLGGGFNSSGDIYFVFDAKGGVKVGFESKEKHGVQYAKNNGIRPVYQTEVNPKSPALQGEVKAGLNFKVGGEFLGIGLVAVGTENGLAFAGQVNQINPPQFCLDGKLYFYLGIYAQIGPDDLNLKMNREIFNSDGSIFNKKMHFEETGKVDACTRGSGNYDGYVKRADNSVPIHNAKVQVVKEGQIVDTTYSDSHGKFVGIKLNKGEYKLRVSAAGFKPFEQSFQIVGGQTTSLETQLMIANQEEEAAGKHLCSGTITNAYTGGTVPDAKITVRSQFLFGDGETVAIVRSDADGNFHFSAPSGKYEITVQKSGFADNCKNITLFKEKEDLHISLNPENQTPADGNLRAVLHWGETPRDLDSHMTGPQDQDKFHVYYTNMYEDKVTLDVDDVDSYGPETISIAETEPGVYSYYVHDYTNRNEESSTALSESGAYVEIYVDNTLLYNIHVPESKDGTVWHVFDYDSETNQIKLLNEFGYENNPANVGSTSRDRQGAPKLPLKPYELLEQRAQKSEKTSEIQKDAKNEEPKEQAEDHLEAGKETGVSAN